MKDKKLEDYIINKNLDLDKIVDDYTPYVRTIVQNMANNNLSEEDKEEIVIDTFFVLWKRLRGKLHNKILEFLYGWNY